MAKSIRKEWGISGHVEAGAMVAAEDDGVERGYTWSLDNDDLGDAVRVFITTYPSNCENEPFNIVVSPNDPMTAHEIIGKMFGFMTGEAAHASIPAVFLSEDISI